MLGFTGKNSKPKSDPRPANSANGWDTFVKMAEHFEFTVKTVDSFSVPLTCDHVECRDGLIPGVAGAQKGRTVGRTDYGAQTIWVSTMQTPEAVTSTLAHEVAHVADALMAFEDGDMDRVTDPTPEQYAETEIRVDTAGAGALHLLGVDVSRRTAEYVGQFVQLGVIDTITAALAITDSGALMNMMRSGVLMFQPRTDDVLTPRARELQTLLAQQMQAA